MFHFFTLYLSSTFDRQYSLVFVAGTRPISHRVGWSVGPSVTLSFFCIFGRSKGWKVYLGMPLPKSSLPLPNRPRQEQSCIQLCYLFNRMPCRLRPRANLSLSERHSHPAAANRRCRDRATEAQQQLALGFVCLYLLQWLLPWTSCFDLRPEI